MASDRLDRPLKAHRPSSISAFVEAMNIPGLVAIGALRGPRAPATTLHADWRAIGNDLKTAIVRYRAGRTRG